QTDHNLPLMAWYAAEPLAALDPNRALKMAERAKLPKVLDYTIQRVAAMGTEEAKKALKDLDGRLGAADSHERHGSKMLLGEVLGKE
uniref:hypothetical protein n=1 Tax=Persicitalea sp. TaxID=3100273 RepID=UPI0035936E19